jgi:uncharacterized protein with NAD-binding domain and iron-sulfur cluster
MRFKNVSGKRATDTNDTVGRCDISMMVFNTKDLVKKMEWVGNELIWTGMMVGRPFYDEPNKQNRPPLPSRDPAPVKNPRPRFENYD